MIDNDTALLINSINRNQDLKLIKKRSQSTYVIISKMVQSLVWLVGISN